jgi:hypothetical protein
MPVSPSQGQFCRIADRGVRRLYKFHSQRLKKEDQVKNNRKTLGAFAAGMAVMFLLSLGVSPAFAAAVRSINVAMGGIQIYVDGNVQVPKDVNGNTVEPLIYDGTTYLPVRALTGMLTNKSVEWDQATTTVYIGGRPASGGRSVPLHTLEPYSGAGHIYTGANAAFSILGEKTVPSNCFNFRYSSSAIYKLDSKYAGIHGKLVTPGDSIGDRRISVLDIYSVDQYGTENLLARFAHRFGDPPVDVDVNITGCNFIKMAGHDVWDTPEYYIDGYTSGVGAFYDITLTTS